MRALLYGPYAKDKRVVGRRHAHSRGDNVPCVFVTKTTANLLEKRCVVISGMRVERDMELRRNESRKWYAC